LTIRSAINDAMIYDTVIMMPDRRCEQAAFAGFDNADHRFVDRCCYSKWLA